MRITIICVGKIRENHWLTAQAEYVKRLGPVARVDILEVEAERLDGTVTDAEAMRREGERLLARIPEGSATFALDKSGVQFSSEDFSQKINEMAGTGTTIVFVIGGAAGLHQDVLKRSRAKLSLSKMTLPHELARVMLLEQIYRATQIIRGGKYHR